MRTVPRKNPRSVAVGRFYENDRIMERLRKRTVAEQRRRRAIREGLALGFAALILLLWAAFVYRVVS